MIFITILILFAPYPASAKMTLCDFDKTGPMIDSMFSSFYNVLTEEEFNYVDETYFKWRDGEIQDCSILNPYLRKINYLIYHEEILQERGISHLFPFTNEFFAQFPNLERVRIKTNQSEVPENLFHGLPHLKFVEIRGDNIETLPTDLFKQNNQLLEFDFISDAFIGDIEPEFFRNFPLIQVLGMPVLKLDVVPWHPPDDICTYNKHLKRLSLGRGSGSGASRTPSSCCAPEWLERFRKYEYDQGQGIIRQCSN